MFFPWKSAILYSAIGLASLFGGALIIKGSKALIFKAKVNKELKTRFKQRKNIKKDKDLDKVLRFK